MTIRARGGARVHLDTDDAMRKLFALKRAAREAQALQRRKQKLDPAAVVQAKRRYDRRNGVV